MVYKVDGNPQFDTCDWSMYSNILKCTGVKLVSCWDLKEHHVIIIIIKSQKGKISIEFPQSSNSENPTLSVCDNLTKFYRQFLISGGSSLGKVLEQWSHGGES